MSRRYQRRPDPVNKRDEPQGARSDVRTALAEDGAFGARSGASPLCMDPDSLRGQALHEVRRAAKRAASGYPKLRNSSRMKWIGFRAWSWTQTS
jgi:hypothetical protein